MLTIAEAGFVTQSDSFRRDNLVATIPATAILAAGPAASDEMLIQAIAQGNRHGMELLFARHNVRIYRFILRITDNATLAEGQRDCTPAKC
jgi:RNA polymerase sigma-70 factor, ECF subfamily